MAAAAVNQDKNVIKIVVTPLRTFSGDTLGFRFIAEVEFDHRVQWLPIKVEFEIWSLFFEAGLPAVDWVEVETKLLRHGLWATAISVSRSEGKAFAEALAHSIEESRRRVH